MSAQEAITRPAKRALISPGRRDLPLATVRGGRDPSDATLAVNERTIFLSSGRTVLLGRSSQREIIVPGVVRDGKKIIVDASSQ